MFVLLLRCNTAAAAAAAAAAEMPMKIYAGNRAGAQLSMEQKTYSQCLEQKRETGLITLCLVFYAEWSKRFVNGFSWILVQLYALRINHYYAQYNPMEENLHTIPEHRLLLKALRLPLDHLPKNQGAPWQKLPKFSLTTYEKKRHGAPPRVR